MMIMGPCEVPRQPWWWAAGIEPWRSAATAWRAAQCSVQLILAELGISTDLTFDQRSTKKMGIGVGSDAHVPITGAQVIAGHKGRSAHSG